MALSESLTDIAIRELASIVCICGGSKREKQSFCWGCYQALPVRLRSRLYMTYSAGYAELYDEAKDFLKIETDRIRR